MSTATCTAPEDDLPFDASMSRLPPLRTLDVAAQRAFYAFHGSGLGGDPATWDRCSVKDCWREVAKALLGNWVHKPEDGRDG